MAVVLLVRAVSRAKAAGVPLLDIPLNYYDDLAARFDFDDEFLSELAYFNVLAAAAQPVVGGELPEYSLAIWHGLNAPMIIVQRSPRDPQAAAGKVAQRLFDGDAESSSRAH